MVMDHVASRVASKAAVLAVRYDGRKQLRDLHHIVDGGESEHGGSAVRHNGSRAIWLGGEDSGIKEQLVQA